MTEGTRSALDARTDAIEEAYEFMLAYAARGRERDDASDPEADVRGFLERAKGAVDGLAEAALAHVKTLGVELGPWQAFLDVVAADAGRAGAALTLVLAQPVIGSALVDNLNASLHLRSLLTDLFLVESLLEAAAPR